MYFKVNYQSSFYKSSFNLFDVSEMHFCFSMPASNNPNMKKAVTFHLQHRGLGDKRWSSLVFLLTCMGLRNYNRFAADPDLYLSELQSPVATFIDEVSGTISMAKEKIRLRKSTLPPANLSLEAPTATSTMQPIGMVGLQIFTNIHINAGKIFYQNHFFKAKFCLVKYIMFSFIIMLSLLIVRVPETPRRAETVG